MDRPVTTPTEREALIAAYRRVRERTEELCRPLAADDYQIQSIEQTSPPKWHIAHVSWFFETFVLSRFQTGYKAYNPGFDFLFNSYYYTLGKMQPRDKRGLLSRPTVEEIYHYRAAVDASMQALLETLHASHWAELTSLVTLGLHHEQQHQELLLMDIKHNFSVNPLRPVYRGDLRQPGNKPRPMGWIRCARGIYSVGHTGTGFAFDNETPRHERLLHDHSLADRLVTNGEYLEFIGAGGYHNPSLWLADGWTLIHREQWQHPLYWEKRGDGWRQFTLGGMRELNPDEPVCHVSYYEADAYARWCGRRLPLEEELEALLATQEIRGNFLDNDLLHPAAAGALGQWYGDLWAWTASPYSAYPGYKPNAGAIGEYNGKFMSRQMVLKGGSCITPASHIRASYRNFFYPEERWAFTGLRLAQDT